MDPPAKKRIFCLSRQKKVDVGPRFSLTTEVTELDVDISDNTLWSHALTDLLRGAWAIHCACVTQLHVVNIINHFLHKPTIL